MHSVIRQPLLFAIGLIGTSTAGAASPDVLGEYACTPKQSAFVPGELGAKPQSDSSDAGMQYQGYYVEIREVTKTDIASAGCDETSIPPFPPSP